MWAADVMLLLAGVPAAVCALYSYAHSKCLKKSGEDAKAAARLRYRCYLALLIALSGYAITASYGHQIGSDVQGLASNGLLAAGGIFGMYSAIQLARYHYYGPDGEKKEEDDDEEDDEE